MWNRIVKQDSLRRLDVDQTLFSRINARPKRSVAWLVVVAGIVAIVWLLFVNTRWAFKRREWMTAMQRFSFQNRCWSLYSWRENPWARLQPARQCEQGKAIAASRHTSGRARPHTVRLMPPAYVKPYLKRQKNDAADAEAIAVSASQATPQQQARYANDGDAEPEMPEADKLESRRISEIVVRVEADVVHHDVRYDQSNAEHVECRTKPQQYLWHEVFPQL
jgi:hypothetical protein